MNTLEIAESMVRNHADMLKEGAPVSVASLLVSVGRCPVCAAPLLKGAVSSRCTGCGEHVVTP